MVSGGHNRKPAHQHALDGTFRPDRHATYPGLQLPPVKLQEPLALDRAGADCWRRLTAELELTAMDAECVEAYCRLWGMYCQLWQQFEFDPLNKWVRVSVFALIDRMDKLGRQFGWTPSSRASLPKPPVNDDDPMTDFVTKRAQSR